MENEKSMTSSGSEIPPVAYRALDDALWQSRYADMTPCEAARFLREKPHISRSFGETLRRMCPDVNIIATLRAFFLELDPTLKPRSLTKKLQNWLADRNPPTSREELYKCAFALQLREEQLDYLLAITDGYGIQYRDGREVVLVWFLRVGRQYREACAFFETLPPYEPTEEFPVESDSVVTHIVQDSFQRVMSLDELRVCYEHNLHRFGTQHARAYHYFENYLERLIQPTSSKLLPEERKYSIRTVMDTYLELKMPYTRSRTKLTPVQRLIKQNWPNETAIKDIRAHNADVPRKLLMLLYVVTENEGYDEPYADDIPDSFDNRVHDHWLILNAILIDCGMARLDVQNAFDWLVLYALGAREEEAMSERMEAVISELYE